MTTGTASEHEAGETTGPVRVGDLIADKYLIERALGVGGMGVVVAARDQLLDRRVAIKFLLPKLAGSETAVQRFMREARAATRLKSEHVVRLLEIDKLPSGTPFFVMEYLEGSDLRAHLREGGPLRPCLAVDYMLQALQAVAEGHVRGVVHRDIKPGNLFLTTRSDGTPLIKVLDFGIAKTAEGDAAEAASLTSSDDVRLGSPAYMPPEQLQDPRDVDTRSDIWSVGATLYELICGRPPFEGPGYLELATRILSQPPAPMSVRPLAAALPPGLEQVIEKCLAKDRARRYADAAELAAALAPFGSDDARVSLTRVRGTLSSMSSLSALVRSLPLDGSVSGDSGLVAAPGAAAPLGDTQTGPVRTTANINAPAAKPRRAWLAVGAIALLGGGALALRSLEPSADAPGVAFNTVDLAPAAAATTPPSALGPPGAAPGVTPQPFASAGAAARGPAPAASASATTERTTAAPASRSPGLLRRTVVPTPTVKTTAAVASAPAVPGSVSAAAAPSAPPGRSAEIERLIERRR